ncbi:MAG TPA: extracellular solute-binding protein, partial [Herpetosiphonaceae bacterium]|nr:extracellular solute-binding protein [Herpetosiphonaceae bacterium]
MRIIARVMLVVAALVLGGCGGSAPIAWPDGVPPRNPTLAETPITLRVWMAADYANQAPIADLVADFQRAYPNITIDLSGYVWQEMAGKVRLAISQGAPPDVAHMHAFAMGAQGMAEPLDDLWQQWGATGEFMPGAMDDVTWQGTRYGVPLDISALFTIYNKAAFEAAGLAPPGSGYTFEQLRSDLEQLTTADRSRYGIALSASGWVMYGLVRSNGGELLNEDGDTVRVSLDDPQVVETLRFFSDLGEQQLGTLPPPQPRQSDHPVVLFSERKAALFFAGPSDLVRLKNEAPPEVYAEVGTAPLPVPDAGATSGSVQGGGSLFVPKGAEHREAAFEFMKWAVSDPYALRMAQEMGRYPVRSAIYEDPFFKSEPLLLPFLEQLKTARPYKLEAYATASTIWSNAVHDVFT